MKRWVTSIFLVVAVSFHHWASGQGMSAASDVIFSTENGTSLTDSSTAFTIHDIMITGNNRTKDAVVLRELPFQTEQSYPLNEIVSRFYEARQQLMNTGLFRDVVVSLKSLREQQVTVQVDVEEKWYLYPLPFVKVVDGKFSQWWSEKGKDINQLQYGIRLSQYNATGRNDNLYVYLMNGYTKQVMLEYKNLALDSALKWTAGFSFAHGKNREINYITQNNKQVAVRDPGGYMRSFTETAVDLSYRPAIKTRHTLSVGYHHEKVADTITKLNSYFSEAASVLSFPTITYSLFYNNADFVPYPTKGFYGEAAVSKLGLSADVNMWQLSLKGNLTFPIGQNDFLNLRSVGMVKLPFKQPYVRQQFLGYNDLFLQGYENFVVDGVAGGYTKISYHHPIINTSIRPPQNAVTKKFRLFHPVPLKVYAKAFGNAGYIHNPNFSPGNDLNNRMLYSGGVGLDIVAFADLILKVEWSYNQLGQNGLYLHQRERY